MTPQDPIRKLASLAVMQAVRQPDKPLLPIIQAAILEGVKLALAEPSESELREIAYRSKVWPTINTAPDAIIEAVRIYLNAASAVRLRELGVKE